MAPRETENNAYAKFWGDKQRALWYVMVFSGAVNGATRDIATQMENSLIPPARGCDSGQQVYSDFVTSASCTPDA